MIEGVDLGFSVIRLSGKTAAGHAGGDDAGGSADASASPLQVLQTHAPHVVRVAPAGRHLSMEGVPMGHILGVLSGTLRCFRMTADGRRHISRFSVAGDIIGLCPLGVPRHSTEAINDARIAFFRVDTIEAALRTNDLVRDAIMNALALELNDGARSQTRLGCFSAEQRVADFLLGIPNAATSSCTIEMPRADIADHLGITIETVSRALNRFAKMGLIELTNPHQFRIPSASRLRRLIQGDSFEAGGLRGAG